MSLVPNVSINVIENTTLANTLDTDRILVIGAANWGEVNEVKTYGSYSQLLNNFKGGVAVDGANMCFKGGASTVKMFRITDGNEAKADYTFEASSVDVLTLTAKYYGSHGNNIGVTITANANNPSNRDIEITDGQTLERFNNAGQGYSTTDDIVSAINDSTNGSSLVVATKVAATVPDAVTKTYLTGGDSGDSSLSQSDFTSALDNDLVKNEDWEFLVIPGQTDNSFHSAILAKITARKTNENKASIYFSGIAENESVSTAVQRTASESNGRFVLVAPGTTTLNDVNKDGSYLACLYAGLTASLDKEVSPTHKALTGVEEVYVDTTTNQKYYITADQEALLEKGITPITKIGSIVGAVRAVTKNNDLTSNFYELNIRRIVDYVETNARSLLEPFIGDPNIERKRASMKGALVNFLDLAKRDEVIVDYDVEVNAGSAPTHVDVTIQIQPTYAMNFIDVTITI